MNRRRRYYLRVILPFVLFFTALALLSFLYARRDPVVPQVAVHLINLPSRYCPTEASLLVIDQQLASAPVIDRSTAVENCQTVKFSTDRLSNDSTYQLYLKLPKALALSVTFKPAESTELFVGLQLGDVNNDNAIDNLDRAVVESALASDSPSITESDIDSDGRLTAFDLSLVNINQGQGVVRPDEQSWKGSNATN